MKLYEKLPDSVTVDGRKIRLDLDFRNVIHFMEILSEDYLTPEAREYLALKCICRRPREGMMFAVRRLLFPGAGKEDGERVTDFTQDADLIRAAFMQEYGINLFRDKLHWFEFTCLLSCLPSGSKYSDILQIRTKPMPTATKWNTEERAWLMKAKAEYAIKLTEKEQEKRYAQSVKNLGKMLTALVGEGDSKNGRRADCISDHGGQYQSETNPGRHNEAD